METSRAPVVTPAPVVEGPAPAAVGASPAAGTSNASLLTALGLATTAVIPPIAELASLLPSLGSVGTVVLDALAPDAAVELATAHASLDWVAEWLATGDPVTGRAPALATQPTAAAGQPATFEEAMSIHERDLAMVDRVFASARSIVPDPESGPDSRPTLLHNSVEWLDEGEADLVILSPTHDGALRGAGAGKVAFFDTRASWGAGATYDPTLDAAGKAGNNAGIQFQLAGVVGTMDGSRMKVYNPAAFPESMLVETLIHEVQHDADQHQTGDLWDQGSAASITTDGSAPNGLFEAYRSEFRAYWMENPPGSADDHFGEPKASVAVQFMLPAKINGVVETVTTSFVTQRQADIFAHLVGVFPPDLQWYNPTTGRFFGAYGYIAHFYVADPAFRQMVDSTFELDTGNPVNSVRIQALSMAIETLNDDLIADAVEALDPVDRAVLRDRGTSDPLWQQAAQTLGSAPALELRLSIESETVVDGGEEAGTVVVQPGDTLTTLAERFLGGEERVPELAALNHLDPNSIEQVLTPGTRILLPES